MIGGVQRAGFRALRISGAPRVSSAADCVVTDQNPRGFSIVMPARNEAEVIGQVVAELARLHPDAEQIGRAHV